MARTVRYNLPMKLDGSRNTRDLGGYPTKFGTNTASGQFVRSDNPGKFTEDDLQRLYDYGVRLQIDFRSENEAKNALSKLKGYKDIEYTNPQMMDDIHSSEDMKSMPATLGEMYIDFLDNKKGVYLGVLRNVIRHMEDCIFWNCTAGKDRAGTFAMIMLKIGGVPDEVVVTDYSPSGDNIWLDMKPLLDEYKAKGIDLDEDMVRSRPIHAEKFLTHLNNTYGTIERWLTLVGLDEWEICALRNKMLGHY